MAGRRTGQTCAPTGDARTRQGAEDETETHGALSKEGSRRPCAQAGGSMGALARQSPLTYIRSRFLGAGRVLHGALARRRGSSWGAL